MIERVLVLCRDLPDPTKSSGELRFSQILSHLRDRYPRVEVFSETMGNADLHELPVYPMTDLAARCPGADLALLEFWFMDTHVPTLRAADIPFVVDSVDIEFLRRARERVLLGLPDGAYRLEEERERSVYAAADQVWVVSPGDAEQLAHLRDKLVIVPNVLETAPGGDFDSREGVVFVGSYHHQPNTDGLRWYRDAILPQLQDLPHVFVGNGAPDDLVELPGFVGGVPDSSDYVRQARVSIAPLRYGAGLKGKVLEAMACGTPVVTTEIGDEGYDAGKAGAAVVTDDPAEFAAAVRDLAHNRERWERMSERGRACAARFAPAVVGETIDAALAAVALAGQRS